MNANKKNRLQISGDKLVLMAAIVVVFIMFTLLNKNFLTVTNIINILIAASLVGLVAIGHTYLIIAGQNDLSPGSLAAFSGVVAALLVSKGVPLSLIHIYPFPLQIHLSGPQRVRPDDGAHQLCASGPDQS